MERCQGKWLGVERGCFLCLEAEAKRLRASKEVFRWIREADKLLSDAARRNGSSTQNRGSSGNDRRDRASVMLIRSRVWNALYGE